MHALCQPNTQGGPICVQMRSLAAILSDQVIRDTKGTFRRVKQKNLPCTVRIGSSVSETKDFG